MQKTDTEHAGDTTDEPDDAGDAPTYRVSHLMDELADAYRDRDMVQRVAPFDRDGISPRVTNRIHFTVNNDAGEGTADDDVENVLETERFAYIYNGSGNYYVLGREVADLRELRKQDRLLINNRRGPFKVYRARDASPDALRRTGATASVELSNENTDTDWLVVKWADESRPWLYVKTTDTNSGVSGDYRYKKVEGVEYMGRIGPHRMYAPSHDDVSEGYTDRIQDLLATARDEGGLDVHPSDADAVDALMAKPPSEVYSPHRANLVRRVLESLAEWYEANANALELETDEDRERAADYQSAADECTRYADAFNLAHMDVIVPDGENVQIYACEDCGKAYTDRFKYPTHRREGCNGLDERYHTRPVAHSQ